MFLPSGKGRALGQTPPQGRLWRWLCQCEMESEVIDLAFTLMGLSWIKETAAHLSS